MENIADMKKMTNSKFIAFRITAIILAVLVSLAAIFAWAAQNFGGSFGLVLGEIGNRFEADIENGHYVAGIDIPRGQYTFTVIEGSGKLSYPGPDGGIKSVDVNSDAGSNTGEFTLYSNEAISLYGVKATITCERVAGTHTLRRASDMKFAELTAEDAPVNGYAVGRDVPAGVYSIKAIAGSGRVVTGASPLSADIVMDSAGVSGMICFYNVTLTAGDLIILDGIDIALALYTG